jgi:hypothetical protein
LATFAVPVPVPCSARFSELVVLVLAVEEDAALAPATKIWANYEVAS